MDSTLFRKNVLKAIEVKGTKLGMRSASKNTARTAMAHAVVELKRDVGLLFQGVSNYILGLQMTQEMKNTGEVHLGDIGADLAVLCRFAKVKMPAATKKAKLSCTRTAALLQLDGLSTDMLALVEAGVFTAPKMVTVKKMVAMPSKGGVKEERDVEVVDAEAEAAAFEGRLTVLKSLLTSAVDIYWRLCFDTLGKAPDSIFTEKVNRMVKDYATIEFELVHKPKEVKEEVKEPVPA